MRNFPKIIGLCTLIIFSFFYTDRVITVIKEQDPIMMELESVKDSYITYSTDAYIDDNSIIPGLFGREIDIDKSYNNMKSIGKFTSSAIIYKDIIPNMSISNNKDKYIIKGNDTKKMVSIIFILNSNNNLKLLEDIVKSRDIYVNYFIDYNYLVKNSTRVKELSNCEVYSYGNNGEYTPDNLLFSNNLISRITNNDAIYCLSNNKKGNTLSLCSSYDLYTILPNIISIGDAYNDVKSNLSSGSMILLKLDSKTIKQLEVIIDYIEGKGLKIERLSRLLSEKVG